MEGVNTERTKKKKGSNKMDKNSQKIEVGNKERKKRRINNGQKKIKI